MAKGDFRRRYNELMSTHDYRSLASLLRNTSYKDDDARQKAFNMADKFEEEADISDRLLSNASQQEKDAYNFIANGPTKSLDPNIQTDNFSKSFSDAWNSLSKNSNDGKIHIPFLSEKGVDLFCEHSGINIDDFESYGISREKNGIVFDTDNPNKINIYNGLYGLMENTTTGIAVPYPYAPGGMGPSVIISMYSNNDNTRDLYDNVIRMHNTVNNANNLYEDLMSKTEPYVLQTVVTGYMGEDDKQLQQAFAAGAMDLQTFKESRKLLEEKYNRLLQTKSLSQYHVFSMNENNKGSEFLEELNDNILKSHLDEEINLAMTEGRLHFSHASNGIMYGTMITINQRYDTKKNVMEEYPARRFFVQDLFKSEAENSLRQDTQVDAQLQYARHQTYGHVYRAKDGGILENWNGQYDNAEYVDDFGNRRTVSKAEALNIMDDDIITRRLINYYKKANLRDKNGRVYTEEGAQIYGNAGINLEILENNIKQRALQITATKYGDPNSDYVKIKANKLASTIMKIVTKDLNI